MRSEGYSSCPVCVCVCVCVCRSVCPHAILTVCAITSKIKDTIVLNIEFWGQNIRALFLKYLVRKLERFTYIGKDNHCVLCAIYSLIHVHLCVTLHVMHALSYGDKG